METHFIYIAQIKLYQMKRLLVILISFTSLSVSAQLKLGAVAGFEFSNIGNYDLIETSSTGNFLIGAIAEYRVHQSPFYLMGQVLYSPIGYRKSNIQAADKDGNIMGEIDLHRINYVRIPVSVLYGGVAGKATIKGGFGPFIAFQTGDKLKIKSGDTFGNGSVLPLYKKGINSVLYGLNIQAGIQWSSIVLNFQYNQSFNGVYEDVSAEAQKWKITGYSFSIGYFFTK
jgi:hypothetical protein